MNGYRLLPVNVERSAKRFFGISPLAKRFLKRRQQCP
jgi:hypothetical protein